MITIIFLVSRPDFLQRVISSIEAIDYNSDKINLLCVVDGSDSLFIKTRNLINNTKFPERLAVKMPLKSSPPKLDINQRRKRIAAAHNYARSLIHHDNGYVLSIEDDTIFPSNALRELVKAALSNRAAAIVQGVELGRWGVPYVGAWRADDVYEGLSTLTSLDSSAYGDSDITRIDAGGLYFTLIKTSLYKDHNFHSDNGLGPDINLGLACRRLGYDNFIVWSAKCTHLTKRGESIVAIEPTEQSRGVTLTKTGHNKWSTSY